MKQTEEEKEAAREEAKAARKAEIAQNNEKGKDLVGKWLNTDRASTLLSSYDRRQNKFHLKPIDLTVDEILKMVEEGRASIDDVPQIKTDQE